MLQAIYSVESRGEEMRGGNLDIAKAGADGKIGAFSGPVHSADAVPGPQIAELGDLAIGSRPEVDAIPEADGERVLRRPVDKIEVEVVLQRRRVQDLSCARTRIGNQKIVLVARWVFVEMPKKREEGTLGTHLVRGLGDLPGRLARRGGFSGAGGAVVVAGGGGGGGGEGRFGRGVVGLEAEEVGVGGGGSRGGGVRAEDLRAEEAGVGGVVGGGGGGGAVAVEEGEVVEAGGGAAGDEAVAVRGLGRGWRLGDVEEEAGRGGDGGIEAEPPRHRRRHVEARRRRLGGRVRRHRERLGISFLLVCCPATHRRRHVEAGCAADDDNDDEEEEEERR